MLISHTSYVVEYDLTLVDMEQNETKHVCTCFSFPATKSSNPQTCVYAVAT